MKKKIIISGAVIAIFLMVSSATAVPTLNKKAEITRKKYEVNESTLEEEYNEEKFIEAINDFFSKYQDILYEVNELYEHYLKKVKQGGIVGFLAQSKAMKQSEILPEDLQVEFNKITKEFEELIKNYERILGDGKTDIKIKTIKWFVFEIGWKIYFWISHKDFQTIEDANAWSYLLAGVAIIFTGIGAPAGAILCIAALLNYYGMKEVKKIDQGNGIYGRVDWYFSAIFIPHYIKAQ